jgi:NADPH-dependent 2,4-dienoyl-CoA reductase/sulfur reductase-like enzyme/rhodanese-related sulfurtransferase
MTQKKKRVVIVGGVAAGASAAARLRRLDEDCEIILLEKGPFVSFANCGLPYYIGGEIADRSKLLVQTPARLKDLLNIDVRPLHEVLEIRPTTKEVVVRDLKNSLDIVMRYDALLLATGAVPRNMSIPGLEAPNHFGLRTIPEMDKIHELILIQSAQSVIIIGGGYIGIEAAEQLQHRGLKVTVIEAGAHILAPFDSEMAVFVEDELRKSGIGLTLGQRVVSLNSSGKSSVVTLSNGEKVEGDFVILALGVQPEVTLARAAGLQIGELGGIRVDSQLRTSDPHIWAAGDAIEVKDLVTGRYALIALAGPANRQGRVVADVIAGRDSHYHGSIGTAVIRVFSLVAACTGASEKKLLKEGIPFEKVYLHPNSHASYYPGAKRIATKLVFSRASRKLLGAQCIGEDGADKRIDIFATAIKAGMTIDQVSDLELCYAPPIGSAKDAVNLAGMAAQNVLNDLVPVIHWHEISALDMARTVLLDVRDLSERERGTIPGSIHLPLAEIRARVSELDRNKEIVCFCASGQRSALACRILKQFGYQARNLSGAYLTWNASQSA